MAKKTIVSFVDDIDGSEADSTVDFGLDGKFYEIDLSGVNTARLRDVLAPFVGAARRSGAAPRATAPTSRVVPDREQNQRIRDWATAKGLKIAERGRISKETMRAYEADVAGKDAAGTTEPGGAAATTPSMPDQVAVEPRAASTPLFSGA